MWLVIMQKEYMLRVVLSLTKKYQHHPPPSVQRNRTQNKPYEPRNTELEVFCFFYSGVYAVLGPGATRCRRFQGKMFSLYGYA